ncbi:MAG: tail fiber domain-containing protein [Proteobacteria bacterium]|nr:tail fiber domain-containing protein [Pseudomonadota bacterium]
MPSGSSPPPAPDPKVTAEAQTKSNRETALANFGLGAINQTDASGNTLTYNRIGTWDDGTPRFEAIQKYSAANQGLADTNQRTQQNIANIGQEQSGRIRELLGQPLTLGDNAREAKLFEMQTQRLNPVLAQQEEALRTRLANQGVAPGSAAFEAEMRRFGEGRNDAYTQLALQGRNQINTELMAERSAPINEISALMSGSQVTPYQGAATPKVQQANTDVAGITNAAHAANMQAWQAEQQQSRGLMGGLFSLGGTLGSALLMSDERVKEDKEKVGELDNGLPIYAFRYKKPENDNGSPAPMQIGLMAQDVQKVKPEAVHRGAGGLLAVDYGKAVKGRRRHG